MWKIAQNLKINKIPKKVVKKKNLPPDGSRFSFTAERFILSSARALRPCSA